MSAVLAIDTASAVIALALAVDGKIVRSEALDGAQDHSRLLLPAIHELAGAMRDQLTGIVVVTGPGSYAGLRVGIATGQGLALALGIPIRGVGTLAAVAAAAGFGDGLAIHPAGRGQHACQAYESGVPTGPLGVREATDLAGPGLAGEGAAAFEGLEIGPDARCRAALLAALPLFEAGGAGSIEAIYLREPNITLPRRTAPGQR
jgi:tRNA threonylcarbamoyladenosine biosynthesis protein TsaB